MNNVKIFMTLDNQGNDIWAYNCEGSFGALDAHTEEDARAEVTAMYPDAEVTVGAPKQ